MSNLEDVLKEMNEEAKEVVLNAIKAEKEQGISYYNKKDKEALKYKNVLKDLGYDKEKFEDLDAFKESITKTKSKVQETEVSLATVNEKLNELTNQLATERKAKEDAIKEAKEKEIKSYLTEKIGNKLYASSYIINANLDKFDVEDNKVVAKDSNIEDTIKNILEENADSLKSEQVTGDPNVTKNTKANSKETFAEMLKNRRK